MTAIRTALPDPVLRAPAPAHDVDLDALARDLAAAVEGEVRFDVGSRSAYSTDASNYRQIPLGVVIPLSVEDAVAAVRVCHRYAAPVLSRGGGTSLAGECTNAAVVIDWSKYCNRLLSVDAGQRTCVVEPGIVLDVLNEQLRDTGLEYGPSPATHDHCTLGGMIGNNSCGATAQRTGKVVDNIVELDVLLYDGTRMWVGETSDEQYDQIQDEGGRRAEIYRQLRALRDEYLEQIRTRYPTIPRRVSGYNLDSLLPENKFHLARALVGSESTLVLVLRAKLTLVPRLEARTLIVLSYPNFAASADEVPRILPHSPTALEGLDDKLINFEEIKHINKEALPELPPGGAWLLVQMGDTDQDAADRAADDLLSDLGKTRDDPDVGFFHDPEHNKLMWDVRESGLGATARVPGMADTWPGWEDSAVPPQRLGDYLRDLSALYQEYGYQQASLYGHFGQGCVHTRIPFNLETADGVAKFRSFIEHAADLVASYGGSFSGEHGGGQARSELLGKMFGDDLVRAFGQFKAIFDPQDRMNPGKVTAPYPLDGNLRLGVDYDHGEIPTHFGYPEDDGSFARAIKRCVGVGKCRRPSGGVMCPSYMVTKEEEHSTRGRARLLFEMLDGTKRGGLIGDGWRSAAVRDALDLCLSCKGCKADCPVDVDMATYKAEFLSHHYARRLRPRAHYSMGWLPVWAALAAAAPRLVNAVTHAPGLSRLAKTVAGVDPRRTVPVFADQTFQRWFAARTPTGDSHQGTVVLWPDTFTNHLQPAVAEAAVEVLEAAGWRVTVPRQPVCCGLTWISTDQLQTAKAALRRTLDVLRDDLRAGNLILGLEPSCTAVFRNDAHDLFPHDQDVNRLMRQTVTLAELLHDHTPGWNPPHVPRTAVIQTHCHHHAVMTYTTDTAVLSDSGVTAHVLDSGCCGLAGNFGFETGHYEISQDCAERVLLPAVRDADDNEIILADGFSCRTQIEQGNANGRQAIHLAELLNAGLHGDHGAARPERQWASRPRPPGRAATLAVTTAATAVLTAAIAATGAALARTARRR